MTKELMEKAHKITKEIVEKYNDVDYKTQLGLSIQFLCEEEKAEIKPDLDTILKKVLENGECVVKYKKWEKVGKVRYYLESNCEEIGWIGIEEDGNFKFFIEIDGYRSIAAVKRARKVIKTYLETI